MDKKDKDLFGFEDNYGFKPEQPTQPNPENISVTYNQNKYNSAIKKDPSKKMLFIMLSIFMAIILFVGGFLTSYFMTSKEARIYDWALDMIEKHYVGDTVENQSFTREDYLTYGLTECLDRYSGLLTPQEIEQMMEEITGSNAGFGISLANGEKIGEYIIHSVVSGSPAENLLFPEDILLKVGGVAVSSSNILEINAKLINCEIGTTINFEVKRKAYNSLSGAMAYNNVEVSLTKAKYTASYLKYYDADDNVTDTLNHVPNKLDQRTGYIKFEQFNEPADAELEAALREFTLKGRENLIFDMRDNPGGYLNIAQFFGRYFLKDTKLMSTKYKDNEVKDTYTGGSLYASVGFKKIIVLVNGGSASASEVLLGAMVDNGTADYIIGQTTFGKGIMQSFFAHRSGYGIRLTIAEWFTPNGTRIHKTGIAPNKPVDKNTKNYPYSAENDSELNAAFDYLNSAA